MRKDKEKYDHGHEVSTARGRLEGALQILIEKTESEDSDESDVDVTDLIHEGRSQSASPRKSGTIKTPLRKRRRLNVDKHYKNDQNSYVLKLYDRSVDLAKFSPQTPLYPVCRAWIKNQPNNQQFGAANANSPKKLEDKGAEVKEDLKLEENGEAFVNSLPLPEAMPLDEEGNIVDTRIPFDLKPSGKSKSLDLLLNVCEDEAAPSVSSLLQEHCSHWGRVREQWRRAANVNEVRYVESTKILKNILVRP
ncbi:protein lin-37 homolog isoform X1 [Daphnia pulex]|uniref:protein lin-37 homolog isoform X1 n=1 Tax=Daphnia pulex TaxID=6669 RepID=UPI001EDE4202|nr:protein lin-37 homolog isoform X1 [Daphnia pulex]